MKTNKPKIKVKLHNASFKILEINGEIGNEITDHKVDYDAFLLVLSGNVTYTQGDIKTILSKEDLQSIPKNEIHKVEFTEDSTLLLFLRADAKLKFEHK